MRSSSASGTRRTRAVASAAAILLVLVVLTLRVSNVIGPKPCTSCHSTELRAATQAGAHAKVGCKSCHLAPGMLGEVAFALGRPVHSYRSTARTPDRDSAAVPDSRCRVCHGEAIKIVLTSNGVRINHQACAATVACTDCHSTAAHGATVRWVRSYDMDSCLECHVKNDRVSCDLCHQGERPDHRVKFASWTVTHGPGWKSTHGMGDMVTCTACHRENDCADCHGAGVPHDAKLLENHARLASSPQARCATCHADSFCTGCHGVKMPHPGNFTRQHVASSVSKTDLCKRCHADSDCTECHVKHIHPGGAVGTVASPGGVAR